MLTGLPWISEGVVYPTGLLHVLALTESAAQVWRPEPGTWYAKMQRCVVNTAVLIASIFVALLFQDRGNGAPCTLLQRVHLLRQPC